MNQNESNRNKTARNGERVEATPRQIHTHSLASFSRWAKAKATLVVAVLAVPAALRASAQEPSPAPVYNVRLVTDSTPDLTDLQSYLRSVTSQFPTPQEKAIAIWRWSHHLRKQTSNPVEGGQYVLDPILLFNNYGYCNCGIVSGLNDTFWLNLGWKARYVQLGDHTVSECSWDGGATWHMFDDSMSFYCFNDAGQVASVTEIENNPRYYLENFAPECGTNPVKGPDDHRGWRPGSDRPVEYQRTLADGYDSFKPPNDLQDGNLYAQWGQRFVLNLRPGEHYTRYFHRLDATSNPRYFRPLSRNRDVDEDQNGSRGLRANGLWRYAPDLRNARISEQVYDARGVAWGDPRNGFAVRAADPSVPGTLVFRVSAANVVTSARLFVTVSRATPMDSVAVSVSPTAGITYAPAWTFGGTGITNAEIDLMPLVAGATEYLVKVQLTGPGAGLESVAIETTTQINRAALPRLVRGRNQLQVTLGPQVETIQFQPSVVAGNHHSTVFEEKSLDVDPEPDFYKPALRPGSNGLPCYATWKIETPTPIHDLAYGGTVCVKATADRVAMLHSWNAQTFTCDYEKTNDSPPYDLVVNNVVASVPPGTRTAYLRYEFETPSNARSYSGPGIQSARMTVHHQPRVTGFTPIEVTYCWVEHRAEGDVERRHTELATSPAHAYTINVGGFRDPTMKWVRLNLKGAGPERGKIAYGYSDGKDVGPGAAPARLRYHWGKNLAEGRTYTLTGLQSDKNPDAGGDLTDGIIAPPDDYVSEKYMPTSVIFEKDASPVATIDLGSVQNLAAVRVHAGQEVGFHLAYPDTITVETSPDGTTFAKVGHAEHNQVFDPPADFAAWEHDESPYYDALPAGGRLAYAYRILLAKPVAARYVRVTCAGRKGWGMLLSEIQVFDKVIVDKNIPPPVVLPKLAAASGTGKPVSNAIPK